MTDSPLSSSLAALSQLLVGERTFAEALSRVAELAIEAVPPAEMVGIAMVVKGRGRTARVTDETTPAVDQDQYEAADGPSLTSFDEQRIVAIDSTLQPGRWQVFQDVAAEHDVLSTLTVPLEVGQKAVGALNLYARSERAFGEAEVETGTLFATQAAVVLVNSQAYWDEHELGDRLREAIAHRVVIEQAKGILMAAQPCGPNEAFVMLVKASQRENVKLRHIAQRVVAATVSRAHTRHRNDPPA
jgi:GAF domain-containing protein